MPTITYRKNTIGRVLSIAVLLGLGAPALTLADKAPPPPPAQLAPPAPAAPAASAPAAPTPAAPATSAPAVPDKDGFVPDSRPATMGNVEEGLPAGPLVGAAYGFIWLAVFGFVVWTLRRTSQLEGELAELRERVERAQSGSK